MNRRPETRIVTPDASPEEAAAIVAAVRRFTRDTASTIAPGAPSPPAWLRASLHEGVSRQPGAPPAWA